MRHWERAQRGMFSDCVIFEHHKYMRGKRLEMQWGWGGGWSHVWEQMGAVSTGEVSGGTGSWGEGSGWRRMEWMEMVSVWGEDCSIQ